MSPAGGALRFAAAFLLGAGLGVFYAFLRPLRRRRNWTWDLVFLIGLYWVWILHGFALCAGDIRPVYTPAMAAGAAVTGKLIPLGRIFVPFWAVIGTIFAPAEKFFQKTASFLKKLFASGKKSGTMKGYTLWHKKTVPGDEADVRQP